MPRPLPFPGAANLSTMLPPMRRTAILMALLLFGMSAPLKCNRSGRPTVREPTVGRELPDGIASRLDDAGWSRYVGDKLGIWVSAARQQLIGIERGRVRFVYTCSTAAKGLGCRENSYQTPTGWHEVDERIGEDAPLGAVFVERKFTGKVWTPDDPTEKDYVLTRILWLRGLETGVNAGPGVDSHDRYIYIHGTPAEDKLGTPASMGCIRLSNHNVIELFEQTPAGTRILITEW